MSWENARVTRLTLNPLDVIKPTKRRFNLVASDALAFGRRFRLLCLQRSLRCHQSRALLEQFFLESL